MKEKNTDKLNRKSTFAVAVRKETTWSSFVDLTKKMKGMCHASKALGMSIVLQEIFVLVHLQS